MPRPKTRHFETLSEMCLRTIAISLANYDPDVQLETTPSNDVQEEEVSVSEMRVVNPFDDWHSLLLEKIIDYLRIQKKLSIKLWQLLITSQTKKLDLSSLSGLSDGNSQKVVFFLPRAADQCPQLKILHMGCEYTDRQHFYQNARPPMDSFHQHLAQFKHLQVLNVSHSNGFDDVCMEIIGIHCQQLRELDISFCHVSDVGIEELCEDVTDDYLDFPVEERKRCKSIEILALQVTLVTAMGVRTALRNLPHLKVLDHDDVTRVLVNMHRNDSNSILPKYLSNKLDFEDVGSSNYNDKSAVPLGASLCPFLTKICMYGIVDLTDSDLLCLRSLERLSVLEMSSCGKSVGISFDGGFVPLFKAIGPQLKALDLEQLFISLRRILEYCPNLESLSLLDCRYLPLTDGGDNQASMPRKRAKKDLSWPNLKELHLSSSTSTGRELPAESLLLALTSAPNLESLVISHCETFDDDVIRRAFQTHSFNSLTKLQLDNCDAVTKLGVDLFIRPENVLESIEIWKCFSLSYIDVLSWRTEIKRNNWDLRVSMLESDHI